MKLEDYPFRSSTDARSAMAERLADFVAKLDFTMPRSTQPFRFRAVLDTWSDFSQRAMSASGNLPAAAVLPDRPVYEDAALTPSALEETWSGGDPTLCGPDGRPLYPIGDGSGDGHCLFRISEIVVPFVLVFRAITKPQRKAIVRRLEAAFVEDGAIVPDVSQLDPTVPLDPVPDELAHPVRYGRVLTVPRYYGRRARFTLQSQQLLDSEASAGENRWVGQLELTGHMSLCVLRRVRRLEAGISVLVNGEAAGR